MLNLFKRIWHYLPAMITWLLVFALPIAIATICVRILHLPVIACLALGTVSFALFLFFAELIFRFAKIVFGLDESYVAPDPDTVNKKLAQVISNVLTGQDTRVAQLEGLALGVEDGTLAMQALQLLRSCVQPNGSQFEPPLVQANWKQLANLMNELRR